MEKKTVKLTNFVKIQEELNKLAEDYKIAKENDNVEEMNNFKEKYEDLKTLLRSNAYYFNKLDNYDVNNQLANETDQVKINHLEAKKAEKKVYKSNKTYITMVEKANTLDDYIVKNSQKKRNFVKKHFKKLALTASLVTLMGLSACGFGKNKADKAGYTTEQTIKEQETTQEPVITQDEVEEITTETLNDIVETNNDGITLNPLEEGPKDIDNANKKDNIKYTDKVKTGVTGGSAAPSNGTPTTTTQSLDPHLEQKEAGTKKTTTTTTTIKQESVKEPEAVDYPVNIIDNTNVNKEEKVTYEYKEEKTNTNETINLPIDEKIYIQPATEAPTTQQEEILYYEENIEQDELYNGDLIDERSDNKAYSLSYRMI